MCTEHGIEFQAEFTDDRCRSGVDTSAHLFVFRIDVRLRLVRRLVQPSPDCFSGVDNSHIAATYSGDEFDSGERATIEQRFREDIEDYWSRTLKLVPTHGGGPPLTCAIEIRFVSDDQAAAHLRADVIKNPRFRRVRRDSSREPYPHQEQLEFRANCWCNLEPRQRDMALDWNGEGWDVFHWSRLRSSYADATAQDPPRIGSPGTVWLPTHQNYLAHEFGHYLGAHHTCHIEDRSVGWCESPTLERPRARGPNDWMDLDRPRLNEYCEGTNNGGAVWALMAMGDMLRVDDGAIFAQRLREMHHFECEKHYVVELITPDGLDGARRSQARLGARGL
jgi:hypothetical protein